MTIASGDSVTDILTEVLVAPTDADLLLWNDVTIPVLTETSMTANSWDLGIQAGVFGYDLTTFLADCSTAGTTTCDYDTYSANFDGWAKGAYVDLNTWVNSD